MRTKCDECAHQHSDLCCCCSYADKYGRPVFGNDPYDDDFNDEEL